MNEELAEQELTTWRVGDLYQFPIGLVLCVGANPSFAYFVTADGVLLSDIQSLDLPKAVRFLHNTGLTYQFESREQAQNDYKKGLFTPYFDIP